MPKKAKRQQGGGGKTTAKYSLQEVGPGLDWQEPEGVPTIYTNIVQMTISQVDVRMQMGRLLSISDKGRVAKTVAEVYMSPQHAKAILTVLQAHLGAYEQEFGVLPEGPVIVNTGDGA